MLYGEWECALTEIHFDGKTKNTPLYVYCDLIESSNLLDRKLPILRVVEKDVIFIKPYYFDVTRNDVSHSCLYKDRRS